MTITHIRALLNCVAMVMQCQRNFLEEQCRSHVIIGFKWVIAKVSVFNTWHFYTSAKIYEIII